jgi:type IV pilus assembly protein PilW
MKLRPSRSPRNRNRGLSLIELLVSMVIGLVIMIAVVSAYIGASGATRVAEAQARMNEDGQAVLTILSQQLRMAGNNPKQADYDVSTPRNPVYNTVTYIVRGCDGKFTDIAATDISTLACAGGGGPDAIAVTYEADRYNTVPTAGGAPTDCLGQALTVLTATPKVWNGAASVPTNVTYTVAENRFYVATSTAVVSPSLYCKGNGGASAQSLVENVEDLQFVYGTAPATATPSTLTVAGYLNAGDMATATGLSGLAGDEQRWQQVVTVRICAVVRSEKPVAQDADSARYVKCDGTISAAQADLRLRRAYSTTVVLRNRVPS